MSASRSRLRAEARTCTPHMSVSLSHKQHTFVAHVARAVSTQRAAKARAPLRSETDRGGDAIRWKEHTRSRKHHGFLAHG